MTGARISGYPAAAGTRRVSAGTRAALEYGPVVAFVLGYLAVREQTYAFAGREYDGLVLLIGAFVPLLVATSAAMWRLTGRVALVQVLTLVIVVVSGGLTMWLNDERFFKMRTTVVCTGLAAVLWSGLWRGRSFLEDMMSGMVTLPAAGWLTLTRRLAWFLLGLAAANEAVWRSFSTDVWVAYDTFVQPAVFFVFLVVQRRWLAPAAARRSG